MGSDTITSPCANSVKADSMADAGRRVSFDTVPRAAAPGPRGTLHPAMRLPQLRQRLRDLGAAPCHEGFGVKSLQ